MRQINWDEPLSDEDVAFLRQMGVVGMEERIQGHQAKHGVDVPEEEIRPDGVTVSALDPEARASTPVETGDGPKLVDPTQQDPSPDVETVDDYDSWKIGELEADVKARNEMDGYDEVAVTGTGANGKVLKSDLIAGLRDWDRKYPDALG